MIIDVSGLVYDLRLVDVAIIDVAIIDVAIVDILVVDVSIDISVVACISVLTDAAVGIVSKVIAVQADTASWP